MEHIEAGKQSIPKKFELLSTQEGLQYVADEITKEYNISKIKIETSDRRTERDASYNTVRVKGGKYNIPVSITLYNWQVIKKYPDEIPYILAHELAHHILNMKKGSLRHTITQSRLADEIESYIRDKLATKLRDNPLKKETWKMTKKEFINNPPDKATVWLVEGKPLEGRLSWSASFAGEPSERGYRIANTVTPLEPAHKNIVKHAIEEGKPVPSEVLADYPNLQGEHIGV